MMILGDQAFASTADQDTLPPIFYDSDGLIVHRGSFGNRLIGNELRKMMNNLNFPLINFGGLSYITDRRAPWRLPRRDEERPPLKDGNGRTSRKTI